MVYCTYILYMYITCVLKLGKSIYMRGNGSHSHSLGLTGSLPLAHNAQHSLVVAINILVAAVLA